MTEDAVSAKVLRPHRRDPNPHPQYALKSEVGTGIGDVTQAELDAVKKLIPHGRFPDMDGVFDIDAGQFVFYVADDGSIQQVFAA